MGVKDSFLGKLLGGADKFSDEQVLQTIGMLVEHAVKHRASDIHIEPHERFVLVRYRIDGMLKGVHKLPVASLPAVVGQIKTLAHLNAEDDYMPQEGQYATLVGEEQFEVQVTTLPVVGGEKVVMHINRRLNKPLSLEGLGFWGENLRTIRDALAHSHGLILVAAPRRSGKTTTIHSLLQVLNSPAISISTVESAIEFRLPGASQTRVRPQRGITYLDGLQAALNQDPNVLMVGSLPDKPTAALAIQAAMGGHLVIAGIHSDSASAGLAHLRTMSDEPYLLATATRTVISQRLVRQLCTHCRERYMPAPEQIAEIEKIFGMTSATAKRKVHELEQLAAKEGVGDNKHVNTTPAKITSLWRANDEGCEACHHTGYQGSIAIVEVLPVTMAIQKELLDHTAGRRLHSTALKEGFVPMGLDGLIKALRGETTVSEVLRTSTA
ncbi:MAG TPA: ATPase, T2SS/T4P/T4SS family [Candidatus Saccharimonadales bacterium]|nr:ATPase, T2SS/T4P/T4SS family [Candidatus Saccharimonadales bacterium]